MKYLRWIIMPLLVCLPFVVFFWGILQGGFEMNYGMLKLRSISQDTEITTEAIYEINTYDAEVSSKTIGNYYHDAAEILEEQSDQTKVYSWSDKLGYPRISVVLELASGYVEVRAAGYNDNDGMFIGFFPDSFSKPDAVEVSSSALPKGILRE